MDWLPMLLVLVSPYYTSAYTFARGTHQPPPIGSARDCTDLEELLKDPRHYAEAIDLCFDDQFSCTDAKPFVGEAMINGSSGGGNPAMIQIRDSNNWLPALEPLHISRGSRRTTQDFVPVVGCMVTNKPRFVLSWADIRCRPSTAAFFPAECDGGASQRNVMIENTEAAISFVERTTRQSARRKLDLLDTESDHVKGRKTALMLILSPKDFASPVDAWTSNNNPKGKDPTGHWLDPTFSDPRQCVETAVRERPVPLLHAACGPAAPRPLTTEHTHHTRTHATATHARVRSQMTEVAREMKAWSWGHFEFDWSVAGPFTADYTQLQTDDRTEAAPVGWSAANRITGVQTSYPCDSYPCSCNEGFTKLDVLGAHAAAAAGVDIGSYDYVAYWLPGCPRYEIEGGLSVYKGSHANQAQVGGTALLMVACWNGAEQTLGHEFGHNCEHIAIATPLCSACSSLSICVIFAERACAA